MSVPSLLELLDKHRVILCVGCGGVGKTTVAAALGLAAARRGQNALCLTIDPARRLANSLGLDRLTSEAQSVEKELFERAGLDVKGSLTVMMLDTKATFDELVARHASSPEARDRILHNQLYQYVSTSLAGTQEYMAMEKLLDVKGDERFDVIILDTPPTSHALDFLEAPERLVGALDSAAMRWFLQAFDGSRRFSLNLVAKGVAVVLRGIGKMTGGGFLEQVAEFVTDLNDLFGGFKERAREVASAFRGGEFAYVLVTTPSPPALKEAMYFADRLSSQGMKHDALVVNRVHRAPRSSPTREQIADALERHGLALESGVVDRLEQALDEELLQSELDKTHLALLDDVVRDSGHAVRRVDVPALPSDVHDLETLAGVSTLLTAAPR